MNADWSFIIFYWFDCYLHHETFSNPVRLITYAETIEDPFVAYYHLCLIERATKIA